MVNTQITEGALCVFVRSINSCKSRQAEYKTQCEHLAFAGGLELPIRRFIQLGMPAVIPKTKIIPNKGYGINGAMGNCAIKCKVTCVGACLRVYVYMRYTHRIDFC